MPAIARREILLVAAVTVVLASVGCFAAAATVAVGLTVTLFVVPAVLVGYVALRPTIWRTVVVPLIARRGIHRLEAWLAEPRQTQRGDHL